MHAARSVWWAVPALAWVAHVCDLAGCAEATTGLSVGWYVKTDICSNREEVKMYFPCYPGGCWHAMPLSRQERGWLSTITHQLCPEPRWFTPELVQVSSGCGMPMPFSSAGGNIPVECLAVVPGHNCIFCFCF